VFIVQDGADELDVATFDIYLYLVKVAVPVGPRDILRALNVSSPSVVHRHLQKLVDLGWMDKDAYGRYFVTRKVGFKGYVWVGRWLVARTVLFSSVFAVLLSVFVAILLIHVALGSPIDTSYALLTLVTIVATVFFFIEALRPRRRMPKQPLAG
jgi:ABC-type transport system involved in Fe-S cluster assembly fused permease/ATPase subunit